ncbi:LysR substrate-binding domain-containing protein [Ruegeria sp.]|uniref:LysR substrate-binding domain-containing protein n=1 Tax=Ruegeria sp. TaxID=1879320 RepID=UPI003C7B2294
MCVLPNAHPLCHSTAITPADLQGHKLIGVDGNIGALVRTAFIETGIPYDPAMELRYCHTACVLANAGVGVTVVDSFSAHFISSIDAQIRPFLPEKKIPAMAVHRRGAHLSRTAQGFVEETQSQLATRG